MTPIEVDFGGRGGHKARISEEKRFSPKEGEAFSE